MRISRARGACLALAALAFGTANGDYVTFASTGFEGSFNRSLAVISLDQIGLRRFFWTASNIVVSEVNLYNANNEDTPIIDGPKASSSSSTSSEMGGGQTGVNQTPPVSTAHPATTDQTSDPRGGSHGRGRLAKKGLPGLSLEGGLGSPPTDAFTGLLTQAT